MDRRRIPLTNLQVSTVCLGTMTFGTPVADAEAIDLVHAAIERGVNFMDTANMYEGYARHLGSAGGVAEEILGKALVGKRSQVILATKVGMKVGNGPEDEGTSPAAIRKHLDLSLKRLATDYVDIYYLHKPDPATPLIDTLGALAEAIQAGKIRHYGISNYSTDQVKELLKVADGNNLPHPVIHQPPYSLLKPDVEKELLPFCAHKDIAVAPYQVLQGGLLTGKYHRGRPAPTDSRKQEQAQWLWDLTEELFDQLEQIEKDAQAKGRTLIEHALKCALALPAVVSLVLGVKRLDQVESLIAAVG